GTRRCHRPAGGRLPTRARHYQSSTVARVLLGRQPQCLDQGPLVLGAGDEPVVFLPALPTDHRFRDLALLLPAREIYADPRRLSRFRRNCARRVLALSGGAAARDARAGPAFRSERSFVRVQLRGYPSREAGVRVRHAVDQSFREPQRGDAEPALRMGPATRTRDHLGVLAVRTWADQGTPRRRAITVVVLGSCNGWDRLAGATDIRDYDDGQP